MTTQESIEQIALRVIERLCGTAPTVKTNFTEWEVTFAKALSKDPAFFAHVLGSVSSKDFLEAKRASIGDEEILRRIMAAAAEESDFDKLARMLGFDPMRCVKDSGEIDWPLMADSLRTRDELIASKVLGSVDEEPVAWAVYWGISELRKNSVHFEKQTAEEVAKQIRSNTEIRPLYAAPPKTAALVAQARMEEREFMTSNALGDVIQEALQGYRMQHVEDGEGNGFSLLDALSVGSKTVEQGQREIELITGDICNAIDEAIRARDNSGEA